jgi:hypothetical protein
METIIYDIYFLVTAIATKDRQDCEIGAVFSLKDDSSPLIVHQIKEGGILFDTPLMPGMIVREINNHAMIWNSSPEETLNKLKGALPGTVSISAEAVAQSRQNLSLQLKKSFTSGNLIVSKVGEKRHIPKNKLLLGMTI